jgi:hypothetical protein
MQACNGLPQKDGMLEPREEKQQLQATTTTTTNCTARPLGA